MATLRVLTAKPAILGENESWRRFLIWLATRIAKEPLGAYEVARSYAQFQAVQPRHESTLVAAIGPSANGSGLGQPDQASASSASTASDLPSLSVSGTVSTFYRDP